MDMKLPKVVSKAFIKKSLDEFSKKLLENQGLVLTGGAIACNLGAVSLIYKNSMYIKEIIFNAKVALKDCKEEERFTIYKKAFIELSKYAGPAIILETISIVCVVKLERKNIKNEARIAELTAAAAFAQSTISEYNSFKEEVRKELGEEKYKEIQNEVMDKRVREIPFPTTVNVNIGENLCYFPYIDKWFSGTASDMEAAMQEFNYILERNQDGYGHESSRGNEIVLIEDICSRLRIDDKSQFAAMNGYESQRTKQIEYWIGSGHINDTLYFTLNIETEPYPV